MSVNKFGYNNNVLHLNVFWRIVLFPIFIPWFLFQFMVFSCFGGFFMSILGMFSIIGEIGSRNWEENIVEHLGFMVLPIIAPFFWLYFYFKYGQYCILFAE